MPSLPVHDTADLDAFVRIRTRQTSLPDGTDLWFALDAPGGLEKTTCSRPTMKCIYWYRIVDSVPVSRLSVVI